MDLRLDGRIAIITGADSGMGQAMAEAYAQAGADVMVTYLDDDEEGAEETRRRGEAAGRHAVVLKADQREPKEVERIFEETDHKLGTSFILVNNAGMDSTGKPVDDMPIEEWDNEIRTNLYGPFYCCRHFIRRRKGAGGGGKILNITSVHQEIPRPAPAATMPPKAHCAISPVRYARNLPKTTSTSITSPPVWS